MPHWMLDSIRRPQYTGANRCWACSLLNMCCVVVAGSILVLYSIPLAVVVVCLGSVSVWLRGYVIPYTPRYGPLFARRLPFFGHTREPPVSESEARSPYHRADGERVLETLLDGGVVRAVGGDVELEPAFDRAWKREIRRRRDRPIAELRREVEQNLRSANRAGDAESVRPNDGSTYIVVVDERDERVGTDISLSRAAAIAELGAIAALAEWLPSAETSVLLTASTPLCAFLDTCPLCGSELVLAESGGCCGAPRPRTERNHTALTCVECHVALSSH